MNGQENVQRGNQIMKRMLHLIGLGRKSARTVVFVCTWICLLSISSARAGVVAYWTYPNNTTGPLTADTTASGVTASIAITTGTTDFTQTGTTINDPAPSPVASFAMHLDDAAAAPVFVINLSGAGLSGLGTYTLTFAGFSSSATTRTITWNYSINGGAFTAFTAAQTDAVTGTGTVPDWGTVYSDTFAANSGNFSTATSLSFRGTYGAATTGGAYFDNFELTAVGVPEPITYALAGFGLVFVGVGARRFYTARRRSATAS
jgi:hypothetical protein